MSIMMLLLGVLAIAGILIFLGIVTYLEHRNQERYQKSDTPE